MKKEHFVNILLKLLFIAGLFLYQAGRVEAAPGDLDPGFGAGGRAITQGGFSEKAYAAALSADGKIVVAGERAVIGVNGGIVGYQALVARFNADGSLDASFGAGGFVTEALHGVHSNYYRAVAVQADGKIVAAGYFFESGDCTGYRPWVVRYNSTGARDTTFGGGDGEVEFLYNCAPQDSSAFNNAIAIQSNGRIVIAGSAKNDSGTYDFAVARLTAIGAPDRSFNLDGLATVSLGAGNEEAAAVAINPDTGQIILAGYISNNANHSDFALVMLTASGLLDSSFGGTGKVTTNTGGTDAAAAVAVQADGKIIVAGRQSNTSYGTDFSLARYNSTGALDATFDGDGKVVTAFGEFYDAAFGIALQTDGKAVAAGFGADRNALLSGYDFALSRYNPNGSLDSTFSFGGRQMTDFFNHQDYGRAVLVQPDGKIVVAGYRSSDNGENDIALARFLP